MLRKRSLYFALLAVLVLMLAGCSDDSDNTVNSESIPEIEGMVFIEAAGKSFEMGSGNGFYDELPIHTVTFSNSYYMDIYEVTQARYDEIMTEYYADYSTPEWNNPYGVGDNYPAFLLEWGDAALFCNALSRKDNLDTAYTYDSIIGEPGGLCELENVVCDFSTNGYRLPTEAEWEYACKAGTATDYFWGKNFGTYPETDADTLEVNSYAVWTANSSQLGNDNDNYGTHQVGQTEPNDFGLYDMTGNLYEWVNDWYGEYSGEDQTDPTGPESSDWHFCRGGSWGSEANYLRSSCRQYTLPGYAFYYRGFRTVLPY